MLSFSFDIVFICFFALGQRVATCSCTAIWFGIGESELLILELLQFALRLRKLADQNSLAAISLALNRTVASWLSCISLRHLNLVSYTSWYRVIDVRRIMAWLQIETISIISQAARWQCLLPSFFILTSSCFCALLLRCLLHILLDLNRYIYSTVWSFYAFTYSHILLLDDLAPALQHWAHFAVVKRWKYTFHLSI